MLVLVGIVVTALIPCFFCFARRRMGEEAAAIALKLPELFRPNVKLWFMQVEAAFAGAGITQDATKFYKVVARLDGSLLPIVADIIESPPDADKYAALKCRILEALGESGRSSLDKLLHSPSFSDAKPSQLLREMRLTGGDYLTPKMLRELWLQRLPLNIRTMMAVKKAEDIDTLAKEADLAVEYSVDSGSSQVYSVAKSDEMEELKRQVESLKVSVDRLSRGRSRSRERVSNAPRHRSPTPHANETCWYHQKHGHKATKCRPPCNFPKKN